MTFEATLGEQLTMIASTNIFYIAIDYFGYYKNTNMKVAASNINTVLKYTSCYLNSGFLVSA